MRTSRLEAFSDGVLAIIITIMVLEIHVPQDPSVEALRDLVPTLLGYVLSFVYVGIYWNNHHHMFQLVDRIGGGVLWANLHLLFWLSLLPAATAWSDETGFARVPVVAYGVVLLLAGVAYYMLGQTICRSEGGARLREALGSDVKGKVSLVVYVLGIAVAFVEPVAAVLVYAVVAVMWLVPDRRVERHLAGAAQV
jgi:uncharacterized membrane protein